MLLALDTSTAAVTVALHDGESVVAESTVVDAMRHGELVAPGVAEVLTLAGVKAQAISRIAVGVGPGPFTGLRVGIVTGRTLGAVLGVPVVGVCSLDALAQSVAVDGAFLVATDARRREVYWAAYDAARRRVDGPYVARPADAASELPTAGRGPRLYPEFFPVPIDPEFPSAGSAGCRGRHSVGRAPRAGAAVPAPTRRRRTRGPQAGHPRVSVDIRPMQAADLPAVLALEPRLFPYDTWTEATWQEELAGVPDTRYYLVAEDAGVIVGYAGLMLSIDQADLQTIGVEPGKQGRGVGRVLLTALVAEARARRGADLLLEVRADNAPALHLYESYGFERIARRRAYYTGADGTRIDALVLRLRLSRVAE